MTRWEDFEVEGPGAKKWRRCHGSSRLAQVATVALVGALRTLAFASKGRSESRSEFVDRAVRICSLSPSEMTKTGLCAGACCQLEGCLRLAC